MGDQEPDPIDKTWPPLEAAPAAASIRRHRFENVEFDESRAELRVDDVPVALEPRPMAVLSELLSHVNEVVTKDELMDIVWGGRPTVDHVLANAVSKLRAAIGPLAAQRIVTIPRLGYRLDGPVDRSDVVLVQRDFEAGKPVPGKEAFILERPLGRGHTAGRSEVWLAQHARLGHRHVFKFAQDADRLGAIKREFTLYRVLQSQLADTDAFARVLDTQFATAPYFIECEYSGPDLLEWDEAADTLQALSRGQRLELFIQITRAVAAAHSVGVLHKDLKPGNILVRVASPEGQPADPTLAVPRVRLTDFGSGRLLQPEVLQRLNLSALGVTLAPGEASDGGSFHYLAPELATGAAPTVQCDVYSLGVLLYQLAVGDLRRPLTSGWEREVDDPLLVQDILAATEGQPERRLASVAELMSRVQSLPQREVERLAGLEHARQEQARQADEARRRQRRPWVLLAAALGSTGLAVSLWFVQEARTALNEALQSSQEARAYEQFLTRDVLASEAVFQREDVQPQGITSSLIRAAGQLGQRFEGDPRAQLLLRLRVAKALRSMGAFHHALGQALAAHALAQQDPDLKNLQMQAATQAALGYFSVLAPDGAEPFFAEALSLGGQTLLDADAAEAIPLVEAQARTQLWLGRYAASRTLAQRWIDLADRHTSHDRGERLSARAFRLEIELLDNEPRQAEALARQMDAQVAELGGSVRALLMEAERMRASKLATQGNVAAAKAVLEASAARAAQAGPAFQLQQALSLSSLGQLMAKTGNLEGALDPLEQASRLLLATVGSDHQFYRVVAVQAGQTRAMLGQYKQAADSLQSHRSWFARVLTVPYDPLHLWLAISLVGAGDPDQALAVIDEWTESQKKLSTDPFAETRAPAPALAPEPLIARGWALMRQGKTAEGRPLMRQGLDLAAREARPRKWSALEAAWATESREPIDSR